MDTSAHFLPLFFHLATVLAPAVIAALALQRLVASRSRNRLLYGAIALVTVGLAVRTLAEMLAGGPTEPVVVIAGLLSPVGWAIVLWVVSTEPYGLYGKRDGGQGCGPARLEAGAAPVETRPLLLGEAARVTRRVVETKGAKAAGPDRAGRARQAVARWRPAEPLPFVPGAGHLT